MRNKFQVQLIPKPVCCFLFLFFTGFPLAAENMPFSSFKKSGSSYSFNSKKTRLLPMEAARNNLSNKLKETTVALLKANKPAEALKNLERALRSDATNPFAMGMSAYLRLSFKKDFEEAKELAQNTLNLYPKNLYALHTLAWYYYLNKNLERSIQVFSEAGNIKTDWFEFHYHHGLSALKNKRHEVARAEFRKAYQLDANHVPLLTSMGLLYQEMRHFGTALKIFQKAHRLASEKSGVKEFLYSKIEELLPLYKAPEPTPKRNLPGRTIRVQKRGMNSFLKTSDNKSPKGKSSDLNPFLTPIEESTSEFQSEKLGLEVLSQEEHHKLGKVLFERRIREDALAEFQTTISLNPTNSLAVSAGNLMKEANRLPFLGQEKRIQLLNQLASEYFERKLERYSLYLYRKVLFLSPEQPEARKNLAFLYVNFNQPITALKILKPLIEKQPDYLEALIIQGYALAKLRRFRESLRVLNRVSEIETSKKTFSKDYARELSREIERYESPLGIQRD